MVCCDPRGCKYLLHSQFASLKHREHAYANRCWGSRMQRGDAQTKIETVKLQGLY